MYTIATTETRQHRSNTGLRLNNSEKLDLQDIDVPPSAINGSIHLYAVLKENPVVIQVNQHDEHSQAASTLLKVLNIPFLEIDTHFTSETETTVNEYPKIFVGEEHIGSSLDLYEEYMNGRLAGRLEKIGINILPKWTFDPASMLKEWLIAISRNQEHTG